MEKETRLAIAYLSRHVDEQPDESKSIFEKLMMYDQQASIRQLKNLIKNFKKPLELLRPLLGWLKNLLIKINKKNGPQNMYPKQKT